MRCTAIVGGDPDPEEKSVRVVVVEDDVRLLRHLEDVLSKAGAPIAFGGGFGTVAAAFAALDDASFALDVALVDLRLPDGSGLDVIRRIRVARPNADVVVITVLDDAPTVLNAVRAGARGYILKDWTGDQIVEGVREVVAGGAPMSPRIARLVLDTVTAKTPAGQPTPLTDREQEVVALLCEGRTYREAATALGISVGTVQTYVKAIYTKLEVESKAELTAAMFRRGLVR
jgi:DNA-binding NarL/FixJ family response regulator